MLAEGQSLACPLRTAKIAHQEGRCASRELSVPKNSSPNTAQKSRYVYYPCKIKCPSVRNDRGMLVWMCSLAVGSVVTVNGANLHQNRTQRNGLDHYLELDNQTILTLH